MEWHTVRYSTEPGIAIVTLDRPERANAWTGRMEVEYRHALRLAEDDPSVGVVVVTGAGRHFCVGADAKALDAMTSTGTYDPGVREPLASPGDPQHPAAGTRHGFLLALSKPVIAAINGAAAGVGFVLACFADIRIAAAGAKLTTSTARLGLPAEYGVSWILPRLVGVARAADLLLSSRVLLAEEALAMGLVNEVHPPERVLDAALEYARRLVRESAPSSLRVIKRQLSADLFRPLGESDAEATRLLHDMTGSPEFVEGVTALGQRRPPDFLDWYA